VACDQALVPATRVVGNDQLVAVSDIQAAKGGHKAISAGPIAPKGHDHADRRP
jgi:hypothetical protein